MRAQLRSDWPGHHDSQQAVDDEHAERLTMVSQGVKYDAAMPLGDVVLISLQVCLVGDESFSRARAAVAAHRDLPISRVDREQIRPHAQCIR